MPPNVQAVLMNGQRVAHATPSQPTPSATERPGVPRTRSGEKAQGWPQWVPGQATASEFAGGGWPTHPTVHNVRGAGGSGSFEENIEKNWVLHAPVVLCVSGPLAGATTEARGCRRGTWGIPGQAAPVRWRGMWMPVCQGVHFVFRAVHALMGGRPVALGVVAMIRRLDPPSRVGRRRRHVLRLPRPSDASPFAQLPPKEAQDFGGLVRAPTKSC